MGRLDPYRVACKAFLTIISAMELNTYLKKEGITYPQFAEKSRMFTKHAVNKWCNNQRIPAKKEMLKIAEMTRCQVLPNDFYGVSEFGIDKR